MLFYFVLTRQNQVVLLDTLDQEVTKFRECNGLLDLNSLVCLIACIRDAQYIHSIPIAQYQTENVREIMQYSVYVVEKRVCCLCGLAVFNLDPA